MRWFFIIWAVVLLGLFATATVRGYSPFGDGAKEQRTGGGVFVRGRGPRHK